MSSEAFVTLATTDGYALGALVLAQSIRKVGTKGNLVVLISNSLSDLIRKTLEKSFDEVIVVDELNSNDVEHLNLLSRPELGITFTKINCWLLEQYSKCVFLDADCVVLRPIDDLFQREEFSAAPDAGWPDCFNSGVFVYRPSKDTFNKLMLFASQQNASFDGGDQGLLNAFFSNWRTNDISRHLPFTYNVTANAFYSYLPAVTQFRNDIHIVHFAGAMKPWQLTFNPQNEQLSGNLGGQSEIQRDFLLSWWRILNQRVWPIINQLNQQSTSKSNTVNGEGEVGSSSIPSLSYGNLTHNEGIKAGSVAHRRAWEAGHVDYFGRDSFSNIQEQLHRNIQQNSYQFHPTNKPSLNQTTSTHRQPTPTTFKTSLTGTTSSNYQSTNGQPTTVPLKSSLKEPTPTNYQSSNGQTTTLKTSSKETKPTVHQPPSASTTSKSSLKETTHQSTSASTTSKSSLKETTHQSTSASTTSKSSVKETTPTIRQSTTPQPTSASTTLKSSVKETTPTTHQPTSTSTTLKSSLKDTPTTTECEIRTTSTAVVQTSLKDMHLVPGEGAIISQNVTQLPTTTTVRINPSDDLSKRSTLQSTTPLQSSSKEVTGKIVSGDLLKERTPLTTNPLHSSSKESTQSAETKRTNLSQTVLRESTAPTPNLFKTSPKEMPPLSQASPHRGNTQTLVGSLRSNENKTPPPSVEHEANWTVKSTIVTAYTQGVGDLSGPTVVSKAVSESSATSSNDIPIKTTTSKQISDSTKSSGLNLTAKTSNDHFNWLFDKIFVTITYTISLCYLLFLVALRRSKNADIIPGNGASVRESANSGKRLKE